MKLCLTIRIEMTAYYFITLSGTMYARYSKATTVSVPRNILGDYNYHVYSLGNRHILENLKPAALHCLEQ